MIRRAFGDKRIVALTTAVLCDVVVPFVPFLWTRSIVGTTPWWTSLHGWEVCAELPLRWTLFGWTVLVGAAVLRTRRGDSGWWPRWAIAMAVLGIAFRAVAVTGVLEEGVRLAPGAYLWLAAAACLLGATVPDMQSAPPLEADHRAKTAWALTLFATALLLVWMYLPAAGDGWPPPFYEAILQTPTIAAPVLGFGLGGIAFLVLRRSREPFWKYAGLGLSLAALAAQSLLIATVMIEDRGVVYVVIWVSSSVLLATAFFLFPAEAPSARSTDEVSGT